MLDLISIGSISVDIYYQGKSLTSDSERFHLAIGGKYQADSFHMGIGGGGANVAIGCAKLGLKVGLLSTIGDNIFKKFILKKLKENKICFSFCDIVKNYYNISSLILSSSGERTILHYTTSGQKLFDHNIKMVSIKKGKVLYLGSLPDVDLEEKTKLIYYAKRNKILTVVNLGVKDCRKPKSSLSNLLKEIDILIINGHEFSELVKAKYPDIFFEENVVNHYIPLLKDKLVVVTEGSRGSFAYYKDKIFYSPAIKVEKIIDTTGAGDGYTAGFIANYYKTKNIEESMKKGSLYAGIILKKIGAN